MLADHTLIVLSLLPLASFDPSGAHATDHTQSLHNRPAKSIRYVKNDAVRCTRNGRLRPLPGEGSPSDPIQVIALKMYLPSKVALHSPEGKSQTLTVLSHDPDTSVLVAGLERDGGHVMAAMIHFSYKVTGMGLRPVPVEGCPCDPIQVIAPSMYLWPLNVAWHSPEGK